MISLLATVFIWVPISFYLFMDEAKDVSRFVEEDTLIFITKLQSAVIDGSADRETFNNNYDLLNKYQATNADKITFITENEGQKEVVSTRYIGVDYSQSPLIEGIMLKQMVRQGRSFFDKQVPVQSDVKIETISDGSTSNFLLVVSTTFQHDNRTHTISIERNMKNVYERYFQFEFDAFGWMFWGVLTTTILSTTILLYFAFRRLKNTIVKQSEAVAISHGDAPNLGKGKGNFYEDVCDEFIELGKRLDNSNENSITALSDVSHYVATHLAEIKQSVDLINYYDLKDKKSIQTQMRRIEDNLSRIKDIHSTIFSLTKVERRSSLHKPQIYELQELLNLTVDLAKNRYPHFEITNPRLGDTRKIFIQRDHFIIIVDALIQNAVKYSSRTNREIVVKDMGEGAPKDKAQFTVTNWGIGVPKDEEKRIFERYYRGSNTFVSQSGVGLGLHMVYKILKLYDGDVEVKNERERDQVFRTTFIVTLKEYKDNDDSGGNKDDKLNKDKK